MKRSLIKYLLLAAAVLPFAGAAQEMITVAAEPSGKVDPASAEKIFAEKNGAHVFSLKPLTDEQIRQVTVLPDANRLAMFTSKKVEDEYRYTLDSAAEQAEKETEKVQAHHADQRMVDTAKGAGEISFYAAVNTSGISFVFLNSNDQPGRYEVIMNPLEPGRFGTQGIHFFLNQDGTAEMTGWQYISANRSQVNMTGNTPWMHPGLQTTSTRTEAGGYLTRITIPWNIVYRVTGDVPFRSERAARWQLGVFRWAESGSASLAGIPHENRNTYLVFPAFSRKQENGVKSGMLDHSVGSFYSVNQKKGAHYTGEYFGYLRQQKNSLPFYEERFYVKWRYGFPMSFAEYYMTGMPRQIEKESLGDAEKTAEENFRMLEWEEQMELRGNFLRKQAENLAISDELIRLEYERFAYPVLGYEELQLEALRDRTFTEKFLEEE